MNTEEANAYTVRLAAHVNLAERLRYKVTQARELEKALLETIDGKKTGESGEHLRWLNIELWERKGYGYNEKVRVSIPVDPIAERTYLHQILRTIQGQVRAAEYEYECHLRSTPQS